MLDTPNSDVPVQSNSAAIAQSLSDNSSFSGHANFTDATNAPDAPLNTSGPNVIATVLVAFQANAQALAAPVSTQPNTQAATTGRRRGPYLKGNQSRLGQVKLPAGYVPINGDNHNGIWQCPVNGCDLQQNPPTTKFSMLRHYARVRTPNLSSIDNNNLTV